MSMRDALRLVSAAIRSTMGMKIATTAVELMTEPSTAAPTMIRTSNRLSLLPPFFRIQSPTARATPVRSSISPTTSRAATMMTTELPNPASDCPTVSTPLSISASTTSRETMSKRTLLLAIRMPAMAIRAKTNAVFPDMVVSLTKRTRAQEPVHRSGREGRWGERSGSIDTYPSNNSVVCGCRQSRAPRAAHLWPV